MELFQCQQLFSSTYFAVVLFVMLYKVVLTFESVNEILKYDHSNESDGAELFRGAVCYARLIFQDHVQNPKKYNVTNDGLT